MKALQLLKETIPNWFCVEGSSQDRLEGRAVLRSDASVRDIEYDLVVTQRASEVIVQERSSVGARLPQACPNRHINLDGSFCLGLNYTEMVVGHEEGRIWWGSLERFLELQQIVARTRIWPPAAELDHGVAGSHQFIAMRAAKSLGREEEYRNTRYGEPSWMTSLWPRTDKDGKRLLNGRAPCPVGCSGKRGRRKLRCECCNPTAVASLLFHERKRVEKLGKFWEVLAKDPKFRCCGTLAECPARKTE